MEREREQERRGETMMVEKEEARETNNAKTERNSNKKEAYE